MPFNGIIILYAGGMHTLMTSSNGSIFRVTGPLCGEFTGNRWIPHTKASDAELCCFLPSAPWINGWVNNREAGDLRRHRAHYDVIVVLNINAVFIFIISRTHTQYYQHENKTIRLRLVCVFFIMCECRQLISTLRPRRNGRNFADVIFKCIFSRMKAFELQIEFHWYLVPRGPTDNESAFVQVMAWRRKGDKLLP